MMLCWVVIVHILRMYYRTLSPYDEQIDIAEIIMLYLYGIHGDVDN